MRDTTQGVRVAVGGVVGLTSFTGMDVGVAVGAAGGGGMGVSVGEAVGDGTSFTVGKRVGGTAIVDVTGDTTGIEGVSVGGRCS
jgi:hypothetical protein